MALPRRTLIAAPLLAASGLAPRQAMAQPAADPRLAERSVGAATAPVVVQEFFSLTCSHCAAFHRDTYPKVKSDLIQPGQVRLVFRDFPLDRLALAAAAVARSLPAERYEGFVGVLLNSQDRWAFTRSGDPKEELGKLAMLAGMAKARFDEVFADEGFQRAILEQRAKAARDHNIEATPTFLFGTRKVSGDMTFPIFAGHVEGAKRG
jgi:protein-disulfide isomerase